MFPYYVHVLSNLLSNSNYNLPVSFLISGAHLKLNTTLATECSTDISWRTTSAPLHDFSNSTDRTIQTLNVGSFT